VKKFLPLLFLFDFLSKRWALEHVPPLSWGGYPFGGIPIFSDLFGISFSLNTVVNTGAAWGLLEGYPGFLFLFRVSIVVGLALYFYFFRKPLLKLTSLWLIGVGALSNALDYLLYGHVIDFLHVVLFGVSFPIFNLADTWITLGVLRLMFFNKEQVSRA
jgi:signal peptidase II